MGCDSKYGHSVWKNVLLLDREEQQQLRGGKRGKERDGKARRGTGLQTSAQGPEERGTITNRTPPLPVL